MLVLLLVLQRFGHRQWGYIPELAPENCLVLLHPVKADGTLGEEEVRVNFDPEDKVHSTWALLGRATTVVGASEVKEGNSGTVEGGDTEELTDGGIEGETAGDPQGQDSEDTQQDQEGCGGNNDDPKDEWGIFLKARERYKKAYAKRVESRNLVLKVSWPEASRTEEWRTIEHARTLGKDDKFIRGHIPEVKCARDFDHYSTKHIRTFLGLQQEKNLGTRTLRLVVMDRLWPIHHLDGEEFWNAFWECVRCTCFPPFLQTFTDIDAHTPGHHRLWVNGIHHGDISLKNLMYSISEKGVPLGVVNDFDLASWVGRSTTNNDRTGTIPFMAIDLLEGGLDRCIPRLYRHDMESFSWVLAYVTVAGIQYKEDTINITPVGSVCTWFEDEKQSDRTIHVASKRLFPSEYNEDQEVSGRYHGYFHIVREITQYWCTFHASLRSKNHKVRPLRPTPMPIKENPVSGEPEVDDPAGSLRLLIEEVDKMLGGADDRFTRLKTTLLEAIETPPVAVNDV